MSACKQRQQRESGKLERQQTARHECLASLTRVAQRFIRPVWHSPLVPRPSPTGSLTGG